MDKLNHFLGKICTILTQPCNRNFDDQQHANTFTGRVKEVTPMGVWIELLPLDGRLAFFAAPLIGIVEEKFIPINDDELKEVQKALESKANNQQPQSPLVQLGNLKSMADKAKTRFKGEQK